MFRLRSRAALLAAAGLAIGMTTMIPTAQAVPHAVPPAVKTAQSFTVYRVHDGVASGNQLAADGFDVLEQRSGDDLFVLGDGAVGASLQRLGYRAVVDHLMPVPTWTPPRAGANPDLRPSDANETYYGGYHTVNAQYAHLDNVASQHADLATEVTFGQSWRKANGQAGGYDLKAICLTKKVTGDCALNPNSTKPRFLLYTQIHAREITTGDIAWRWIDYLVNGYGSNTTVTNLMNSTELWVVPIANPDGVDMVQQGGNNPVEQRKNADGSHGSGCGASAYSQLGVDLNRNFGSHWGGASTSSNPCDQTYKGPAADSEQETTAAENLWRELYPAVRTGTSPTAPSPTTAKGLTMTLHSDASVVIFPWDYSATVHSGNDTSLRAIGKKLGSITGYPYGQAGQVLYNASGDTDDWAYDKLGVASYTIEVGDNAGRGCSGFLPAYSCQSSFFWPKMQPALVYAAQQATAPFKNG